MIHAFWFYLETQSCYCLNMLALQKYLYKSQLIMLFLVPLWVALGRILFGAGGWLILITLFFLGPLLLIGLLTVFFISRKRDDVKKQGALTVVDTILLSIVYVGSFIFGFFIIDGGDTEDSVGSAASMLFNLEPSDAGAYFAVAAMIAALISLISLIIFNIYKLVKR